MLRVNTTKAKQNLFNYVKEYATERIEEEGKTAETPKELYAELYKIFKAEKSGEYYKRMPESEVFEDWARGLAMNGLFCYYYNRSAVDDLQKLLEETPEEASRHTEEKAEAFLTRWIYDEMKRNA